MKLKNLIPYALCLMLIACSGFVRPEHGSENIVRLEGEPIGCAFMYTIDVEVSVFDERDAKRYLRNRIVDQQRRGNAYWITSKRTRPNEWAVFGPERAFIIGANVYDCPDPNNVQIR